MQILPLLGVLLAPSGVGSSSGAAPERVAVLPIDSHATLPDTTRIELRSAIERGLRRVGVKVVRDGQVDQQLGGTVCADTECVVALAGAVEAEWVLRPTVTVGDSVYAVHLEVVDARGRVLASASERCEICGYHEVTELVVDRSAALGDKVSRLRDQAPRLRLRSTPSGARVWVDGRSVGRTPLEHEVEPGPHDVRVQLRGYVSEQHRVTAVAGTEDTLSVSLSEAPRRRGPWLPLGLTALATGVAGVGAGAALVALDERDYQRNCNPDVLGNCSQRYDTLAGGVTLAVTGGVLLATGAAMLVIEHRRRRGRTLRDARWRPQNGLAIAF